MASPVWGRGLWGAGRAWGEASPNPASVCLQHPSKGCSLVHTTVLQGMAADTTSPRFPLFVPISPPTDGPGWQNKAHGLIQSSENQRNVHAHQEKETQPWGGGCVFHGLILELVPKFSFWKTLWAFPIAESFKPHSLILLSPKKLSAQM